MFSYGCVCVFMRELYVVSHENCMCFRMGCVCVFRMRAVCGFVRELYVFSVRAVCVSYKLCMCFRMSCVCGFACVSYVLSHGNSV